MPKPGLLTTFAPGKIKRSEVQGNDDKLKAAADTAMYVDEEAVVAAQHDFQGGLKSDSIAESTAGSGVTVDDVHLKDGTVDGVDVAALSASHNALEAAYGTHNHDGRYYTQSEVNTLIAGTATAGHNHDDRYYTESETNTLLAGKSDTSHTHTNLPSSGEKAALAGTSGTPGAANKYVTNGDARLSDVRTPAAHKHNASDIDAGVFGTARGGTGLSAIGSALQVLRVNSAGSALEFGPPVVPLLAHAAYRSTNQALAADTSWQTIVFPTTEYGSGIINAVTGVATIPSDGIYLVQFSVRRPIGAGRNDGVRLLLDGTTSLHLSGMDSDNQFPCTGVRRFTTGQTLRVQLKDNGTGETAGAGSERTHFHLVRLGDL